MSGDDQTSQEQPAPTKEGSNSLTMFLTGVAFVLLLIAGYMLYDRFMAQPGQSSAGQIAGYNNQNAAPAGQTPAPDNQTLAPVAPAGPVTTTTATGTPANWETTPAIKRSQMTPGPMDRRGQKWNWDYLPRDYIVVAKTKLDLFDMPFMGATEQDYGDVVPGQKVKVFARADSPMKDGRPWVFIEFGEAGKGQFGYVPGAGLCSLTGEGADLFANTPGCN